MPKGHDHRIAEADDGDGVTEAWNAVVMCRDALARQIFVDDDLIGHAGEHALIDKAPTDHRQSSGQWTHMVRERDEP